MSWVVPRFVVYICVPMPFSIPVCLSRFSHHARRLWYGCLRYGRLRCAGLVLLAACAVGLGGCDMSSEPDIPEVQPPDPPEVFPTDQAPAWSPSGNYIAYHHDALWTDDTTDVSGLYVRDLEADSTWLVIEGSARSPDWRPDGERIAFSAGDIYTIRPNGSDLRRVTSFGSSFQPRWSPGSNTLTFGRSGNQEEVGIWFAHLTDSTFTKFGFGATPADWSPSGERLVYDKTNIFTADTSRADSTQLTNNEFVDNRDPAWSPDGQWIAWSPINDDGNYELWVMRSDGSDKQKLIERGRGPAWGPNSERIVFARPGRESDLTALWTIRRDGSDLRQITDPSRNPLN